MGGGGGSKPEVKPYTPPPIDNSPAKNPIANYFQNGGGRPQSPYELTGLLGQSAPQNPFLNIAAQAAPLLRREQVDQPDILALLQMLSQKGKR